MTTPEERYLTGRMYGEGKLGEFAVGSTLPGILLPSEPLSPFQTLFHFAQNAESGILGVELGEETVALSLGRGSVIKTASNIISDDEEMLIIIRDTRLLTRTQLQPAIERCMETSVSLDQVLFQLKLVSPRELVRLWRNVHEARLLRVLQCPTAAYTFARADLLGGKLAGSAVHLDIQPTLRKFLNDALQTAEYDAMVAVIDKLSEHWIEMNAASTARAREIGFSGRELKALDKLMDGTRTVEELPNLSSLSRKETIRLVWLCLAMDVATVSTTPPQALLDAQERELASILERMSRQDYFERLGSHWSRHSEEARLFYAKKTKEYAPDGRLALQGPQVAALCQQLLIAINEAWVTVHSTTKRRNYRMSIVSEENLRVVANTLLKQAETAEYRGEIDAAHRLLDTAMDLNQSENIKEALRRVTAVRSELDRRHLERMAQQEQDE